MNDNIGGNLFNVVFELPHRDSKMAVGWYQAMDSLAKDSRSMVLGLMRIHRRLNRACSKYGAIRAMNDAGGDSYSGTCPFLLFSSVLLLRICNVACG